MFKILPTNTKVKIGKIIYKRLPETKRFTLVGTEQLRQIMSAKKGKEEIYPHTFLGEYVHDLVLKMKEHFLAQFKKPI